MRFAFGTADGLGGPHDVSGCRPARPQITGPRHLGGNGRHTVEIAWRRDGKTGLNHVDAEVCQRFGEAYFLADIHREAGRLLAVAQGGVEYDDAAFVHAAEIGVIDAHNAVLGRPARGGMLSFGQARRLYLVP